MYEWTKKYLHTIDTFECLKRNLVEIGLGGCRESDELGRKLLSHGAATYRDHRSTTSDDD